MMEGRSKLLIYKKFTFLAPPGGTVSKRCATRSMNFNRTSHLRLKYQNLEL